MRYLGDIAKGATVAFLWSTVDGNGASCTRTVNGTIKVRRHSDGSTITVGITDNKDTPILGLHECKVSTSDANYTINNDYTVYLENATIDGRTINAVLGHFSIKNKPLQSLAEGSITDAVAPNLQVNVTRVEGQILSAKVGENFNFFFQNEGYTATQHQDDVGGGSTLTLPDIANAVWGWSQSGYDSSTGTFGYYLDAQISTIEGVQGPGSVNVTVQLIVDEQPVADADIWITTDSAGNNVVEGTYQTNSLGRATFHLTEGITYYLWAQKDGYNLPAGKAFVAVGD